MAADKFAVTLFASSARTATVNGSAVDTKGAKGIHLTLDITAVTGTSPTAAVKIQRRDPVSGNYVDLPGGAFASQTGTGTSGLTIYPGIAETADVSVSDVLSEEIRAVFTIGGTDTPTFTFSLAGTLIN